MGMEDEVCVLTCTWRLERCQGHPGRQDATDISWKDGECGVLDQDFGAVVAGESCRIACLCYCS